MVLCGFHVVNKVSCEVCRGWLCGRQGVSAWEHDAGPPFGTERRDSGTLRLSSTRPKQTRRLTRQLTSVVTPLSLNSTEWL